MKKTATITFHKAQNYGSVLQTYALQNFILSLNENIYNDVIDIQPKRQKELYDIFKKNNTLRNIIYNIFSLLYYKQLNIKKTKFEKFLQQKINLTKKITRKDHLMNVLSDYDYLISGSDQIWNVRNIDFDDFFYLDWNTNAKRVSYAASFGPLQIDWDKYDKDKYSQLLNKYTCLSTRETGSMDAVRFLTGRISEIHVDPTLLLDDKEWRMIGSGANYNCGRYILLYCLEPSREQLKMAKRISKSLRLPILITKYNNKHDLINGFVKKYDCGPEDFISYVDNAALVLTSSFHGSVFSLIFKKPFYVFEGMNDKRISTLLTSTNLENRSILCAKDISKISLDPPNEEYINKFIEIEKEKSKNYLLKALDLV